MVSFERDMAFGSRRRFSLRLAELVRYTEAAERFGVRSSVGDLGRGPKRRFMNSLEAD